MTRLFLQVKLLNSVFVFIIFLAIPLIGNEQLLIANNNEWKALLHISNDDNTSEITDVNFFASNVNNNPLLEMQTLLNNISADNICKYPLRYKFLSKKFNLQISFEHCQELQNYLNESQGDSLSLLFASSSLDSPASYFGHIFLKINKQNNLFFSKTIGYGAEFPNNINPLKLIYGGMTNNLKGKYIINNFYELLEQYSNIEQRSLYEYSLLATKDSIENILLHYYELKDINVNYKFFSENCAYQIAWFLEVSNIKLIDQLNIVVKPVDFFEIIEENNLATSKTSYLPLSEKLFNKYKMLTYNEKLFYKNLLDSEEKIKIIENIQNQSDRQKMSYLLHGYYELLFKKDHLIKGDHQKIYDLAFKPYEDVKSEKNFISRPSYGFSIGIQNVNHKHYNTMGVEPTSFNKLYDRNSLLNESSLDILKFGIISRASNYKVDYIDIVSIENFGKDMPFYNAKTWNLYFELKRKNFDTNIKSYLGAGNGLTFGTENTYIAFLLNFEMYLDVQKLDLKPNINGGYWFDKSKIQFELKNNVFFNDDSYILKNFNLQYVYKPNKHYGFLLMHDLYQDTTNCSFSLKF